MPPARFFMERRPGRLYRGEVADRSAGPLKRPRHGESPFSDKPRHVMHTISPAPNLQAPASSLERLLRMKQLTKKIAHYAVLIGITLLAGWVMWLMSGRGDGSAQDDKPPLRPLPVASAPRAPVLVRPLHVEMCEVISTFSGKIEPWETYQVAFEAPGRVLELGKNASGEPLDDGDRVSKGQVLAVLDQRIFRSQRGEAAARLEQANSELRRAQQIRQSNPSAISESELQRLVTEQALAQAKLEVAAKSFEDTTLRAPVDATISRRLVNAGESINAYQLAFELIENDNVLLVVNVPESQVRELEARMRAVDQNRREAPEGSASEESVFRAHVQLEGKNSFGQSWPVIDGEVYQIAQTADPQTSLFAVEVELPNEDRLLRPGMVATARLVVDRVAGYRAPEAAVIYRSNDAYLFTTEAEVKALEMMYWEVGETTIYRARRIELSSWVDQVGSVIVPAEAAALDNVIVRGQHRLADGQLVRPMEPAAPADLAENKVAPATNGSPSMEVVVGRP